MRPAFIFKQSSAVQQRRLFGGPFAPTSLVRRGRVPILPMPRDLRLQVVHSDDAARGYQLAITKPVEGAFNIAAAPTLSAHNLADVLGATLIPVPPRLVRAAMSAGWRAHAVPAEPALWQGLAGDPGRILARRRREVWWPDPTAGSGFERTRSDSRGGHRRRPATLKSAGRVGRVSTAALEQRASGSPTASVSKPPARTGLAAFAQCGSTVTSATRQPTFERVLTVHMFDGLAQMVSCPVLIAW